MPVVHIGQVFALRYCKVGSSDVCFSFEIEEVGQVGVSWSPFSSPESSVSVQGNVEALSMSYFVYLQ